jgi:hypothetical protein
VGLRVFEAQRDGVRTIPIQILAHRRQLIVLLFASLGELYLRGRECQENGLRRGSIPYSCDH